MHLLLLGHVQYIAQVAAAVRPTSHATELTDHQAVGADAMGLRPVHRLLQVAAHARGVPALAAVAERHFGGIAVRFAALLVRRTGGRVRLIHVHAVQQLRVLQRRRPVIERIGRRVPAGVEHQRHVCIDRAHTGHQFGVQLAQIARSTLHARIPLQHVLAGGVFGQRGAIFRCRLIDQVVAGQRRVPFQRGRQITPEALRRCVVVEGLPQALIDHVAVLLFPAQQRQ
ncbi:hypothetical protein D3C71_1383710 [compost metagenome]